MQKNDIETLTADSSSPHCHLRTRTIYDKRVEKIHGWRAYSQLQFDWKKQRGRKSRHLSFYLCYNIGLS